MKGAQVNIINYDVYWKKLNDKNWNQSYNKKGEKRFYAALYSSLSVSNRTVMFLYIQDIHVHYYGQSFAAQAIANAKFKKNCWPWFNKNV